MPRDRSLVVDGRDVVRDVHDVLDRMAAFAESVRSGEWRGHTGERIRAVVNIGIGGSDLGPAMAYEALRAYGDRGLTMRFVSNVDATDVVEALRDLDPATTLAIVSSKTFTTVETMTNAHAVRQWLVDGLGGDETAVAKHVVAVSTNLDAVAAFGIDPANAFGFWDWVGGRYSMDSAIGLSTMVAIGPEAFRELLVRLPRARHALRRSAARAEPARPDGARSASGTATSSAPRRTPSCRTSSTCARFPAYLQQLVMESNGKRVTLEGEPVAVDTSPIVWGEPGTNGQHSFHQLLHQGTALVPADIIAFATAAQSAAAISTTCCSRMRSRRRRRSRSGGPRTSSGQRGCRRRSSRTRRCRATGRRRFLLLERLTPFALGSLVALYEHVVFTQGVVWGIDSFDQWGVELGKELAQRLAPAVGGAPADGLDPSTAALVERIHAPARGSLNVLELHEAVGAFERIESWLRERGFFEPGGEELVADLYLGYGLSCLIRRTSAPAPSEPCVLPLVACAVRTAEHTDVRNDNTTVSETDDLAIGEWRRTWPDARHAAAVDAVRGAIARGDVYQVNLVQHLSAPFAGRPAALAARLGPLTQPSQLALRRRRVAPVRGRRLGDRLGLARAVPRAAWAARLDTADQGHTSARPARGAPRLGEGRGGARDDRRPRAERPLARLRPRQRALARPDGRRAARGRRAPRVDRRRASCARTSAWPSSSARCSPAGR